MDKIKFIKKYRNIILIIMDIVLVVLSYFAVYFFKNQSIFNLLESEVIRTVATIIYFIIIYEGLMLMVGLYNNITRFENGKDYVKYALAAFVAAIITSTTQSVFSLNIQGIRTNLLAALIIAILTISYRVVLRNILGMRFKPTIKENLERKKLLIIGGGEAGRDIITTVQKDLGREYKIVGVIDDNLYKKNHVIAGIKILGDRNCIKQVCADEKIDKIFFAISHIDPTDKSEILNICQETGVKVKILPGIADIIRNRKITDNLRDVEIEDLLGREPIKLDNGNIKNLIENKVVLVTGAGGSIGSELCRQIVLYNPKLLVMLDIYENTLYDIQMELIRKFPNIKIQAIIGSIRDKKRLDEIFDKYKPYLVFHAAAHKHVPLMEVSPLEAIKNNIFGTWNLLNCVDEYKVKRFIQISTDKAVNPTNIMGATKRMCEMMLQAKDKVSETEFAAVRFGNVLGSNGSVIPLFKKQIKDGGPITLTHKEITRYFMTIPEAVSLVIQAMTFAKGGEIFVLDMGKPVKIYDLATTLIKLSGYEPHKDIDIKITGLRPGEKLYEELLMANDGLAKTKHEKIFVEDPEALTITEIEKKLNKLKNIISNEKSSEKEIKSVMHEVVPTFIEAAKANKIVEHKEEVKIEKEKMENSEDKADKKLTSFA